jgi:uncharacterized protein involved in outer membrane biogenesis
MKRLLKLIILLVLLVSAASIFAYLSRTVFLRSWLERAVTQATGMELQIGRLDNPFLSSEVRLENLVLVDRLPSRPRALLEMPAANGTLDVWSLLQRDVRWLRLKVEIEDLTVVREKDGRINLLSMLENLNRQTPPTSGFQFGGIDRLDISLVRVKYRDLGRPQDDDEVYLGLRERSFKNVKTGADFTRVAAETLADTRVRFFPKLGLRPAPAR